MNYGTFFKIFSIIIIFLLFGNLGAAEKKEPRGLSKNDLLPVAVLCAAAAWSNIHDAWYLKKEKQRLMAENPYRNLRYMDIARKRHHMAAAIFIVSGAICFKLSLENDTARLKISPSQLTLQVNF